MGNWLGPEKVGGWLNPESVAGWLSPESVGGWLNPESLGDWLDPEGFAVGVVIKFNTWISAFSCTVAVLYRSAPNKMDRL